MNLRLALALAFCLAAPWMAACGDEAAGPPAVQRPGPQTLATKPGEGEQCIVCDESIRTGEVVELRYKGRRFFVAAPLLGELMADPDRYVRKVQARVALFDETSYEMTQMQTGWLWFGIYVLAGIVFGAVCGALAVTRALPPLPWFFAGLVGNVGALVVLMAWRGRQVPALAGIPPGLGRVASTYAPVPCPRCGRCNHPSAQSCAGCAAALTQRVASEAGRVRQGGAS